MKTVEELNELARKHTNELITECANVKEILIVSALITQTIQEFATLKDVERMYGNKEKV